MSCTSGWRMCSQSSVWLLYSRGTFERHWFHPIVFLYLVRPFLMTSCPYLYLLARCIFLSTRRLLKRSPFRKPCQDLLCCFSFSPLLCCVFPISPAGHCLFHPLPPPILPTTLSGFHSKNISLSSVAVFPRTSTVMWRNALARVCWSATLVFITNGLWQTWVRLRPKTMCGKGLNPFHSGTVILFCFVLQWFPCTLTLTMCWHTVRTSSGVFPRLQVFYTKANSKHILCRVLSTAVNVTQNSTNHWQQIWTVSVLYTIHLLYGPSCQLFDSLSNNLVDVHTVSLFV